MFKGYRLYYRLFRDDGVIDAFVEMVYCANAFGRDHHGILGITLCR